MEFKDNQAIYLQIADYFMDKVLSGEWKADERVPAVRELAVSLEVNPNTAMRTYTILQDKGVLYNKRGIGFFVAPEAFDIIFKMKKDEFINKELPGIFRTMDLLKLSPEELIRLYNAFKADGKL
ncbi:MAG: GntR family transcriptional regulator [Bacteroidota bacterium]|nr:GntR family transcriptional regulator [Bacteroidota bacterium]